MKLIFSLFLTFLAVQFACSSSTINSDGLDIVLERETVISESPITGSGHTLAHTAKINWEQYFLAQPTSMQEKKLEELLSQMKDADKQDVSTIKKRARQLHVLGQFSEAQGEYLHALRLSPHDGEILIELAELNLRIQKTDKMMEFLSEAKIELEARPMKDPDMLFRYRYIYALGLLSQGSYEKAHSILSDLVSIEKGFTPAYIALANSYLARSQLELAEFVAKRGIDRAKEMAGLYAVLAQVSVQKGAFADARLQFNRALKLDPQHTNTLVSLASFHLDQGDFEASEIVLKKALAATPSDVASYIALGHVQRRMGQNREAKISFEKALALNPFNPAARFHLAVLLYEDLHQGSEALRLLREVEELEDKAFSSVAKNYRIDIEARAAKF